jgi:hypothetical protein
MTASAKKTVLRFEDELGRLQALLVDAASAFARGKLGFARQLAIAATNRGLAAVRQYMDTTEFRCHADGAGRDAPVLGAPRVQTAINGCTAALASCGAIPADIRELTVEGLEQFKGAPLGARRLLALFSAMAEIVKADKPKGAC